MSVVLAVEALGKSYVDGRGRRQVLDDATFEVAAGEVVALCGPSGSGKTTLLNACAGLVVPDSGAVWLASEAGRVNLAALPDAARARLRRRHVGYVFQFFNLVPTLTVRENVLLPLALAGRRHLQDAALARLAALGLGAAGDAFPERLSGGERQRVAIARALAHEPALVLADEPTGNLDAGNGARVVDLLWSQVRALGCALLIATHDPAIAARADRVLQVGR
jgi:putative ABC transport system ATP-binding protein